MQLESQETKEKVQNRLRRIEGQVRGVQGMIDDGRDCREIIQQLSAIRSAVQRTGMEVMRAYAQQCFDENDMEDDEVFDYLFATLGKWT